MNRFRRWLTELCDTHIRISVVIESSKTRNRSRAQKEAWARRKKVAGLYPQIVGAIDAAENTAGLGPNGGSPNDASEVRAPAVPDATRIKCRYCGWPVFPENECFNKSMAEACHKLAVAQRESQIEIIGAGVAVPDTHDFRDYPSRDRPDWDLDSRGNPLKPGT